MLFVSCTYKGSTPVLAVADEIPILLVTLKNVLFFF
jgi:hypothetical protein